MAELSEKYNSNTDTYFTDTIRNLYNINEDIDTSICFGKFGVTPLSVWGYMSGIPNRLNFQGKTEHGEQAYNDAEGAKKWTYRNIVFKGEKDRTEVPLAFIDANNNEWFLWGLDESTSNNDDRKGGYIQNNRFSKNVYFNEAVFKIKFEAYTAKQIENFQKMREKSYYKETQGEDSDAYLYALDDNNIATVEISLKELLEDPDNYYVIRCTDFNSVRWRQDWYQYHSNNAVMPAIFISNTGTRGIVNFRYLFNTGADLIPARNRSANFKLGTFKFNMLQRRGNDILKIYDNQADLGFYDGLYANLNVDGRTGDPFIFGTFPDFNVPVPDVAEIKNEIMTKNKKNAEGYPSNRQYRSAWNKLAEDDCCVLFYTIYADLGFRSNDDGNLPAIERQTHFDKLQCNINRFFKGSAIVKFLAGLGCYFVDRWEGNINDHIEGNENRITPSNIMQCANLIAENDDGEKKYKLYIGKMSSGGLTTGEFVEITNETPADNAPNFSGGSIREDFNPNVNVWDGVPEGGGGEDDGGGGSGGGEDDELKITTMGSVGSASSFINYWGMDANTLNGLGLALGSSVVPKGFDTMSHMIEIIQMPFSLTNCANAGLKYINLGTAPSDNRIPERTEEIENPIYPTGIKAYLLTDQSSKMFVQPDGTLGGSGTVLASYKVEPKFGNYLDYKPFSDDITLTAPYFGSTVLPMSLFNNKTIKLKCAVDVFAHEALLMVFCNDTLYTTLTAQLGSYQIMSAENSGRIQQAKATLATSIATGVINSGVQALAGNYAGAGLSAVHTAVQAYSQATSLNSIVPAVLGSKSSSRCGFVQPPAITISYSRPATNVSFNTIKSQHGLACNFNSTLSNLHGYTVCSNPHVDIARATSDEKNEITRLLSEGVILP